MLRQVQANSWNVVLSKDGFYPQTEDDPLLNCIEQCRVMGVRGG
jgi:hypothetical protein